MVQNTLSSVKYPRCSLRRQSTYADAQEDPSQIMALASVWLLFLGVGSSACLVPVMYTIGQAYKDVLNPGFSNSSQASELGLIALLHGMLFMMLGSVIGYPVASASVKALRRLWKNDLVALKGACPNCGRRYLHLSSPASSITLLIELIVMCVNAC